VNPEGRPPVTVADLMDMLRMFSGEFPVVALYDCRCASGSVISVEIGSVEIGPDPDSERESVILIVE
jgi:hypothetical protein